MGSAVDDGEDVSGLFVGGGFEIAPDEFAVLEKVGLAGGEFTHFEGDAKGLDHGGIFIGEEGEGEVELVFEGLLVFNGVGTDADYFDAFLGKFFVGIAQGAGLLGATGGVGLGVEIDEGVTFGSDFLHVDVLAVIGFLGDVGGSGAFGDFVGLG